MENNLEAGRDPIETLRSDAQFLRHYLAHYVVGVQTRDSSGNVLNSFAAVQIPDWAVKQRLDDIDAATSRFAFMGEIAKERQSQDWQWGGPEHERIETRLARYFEIDLNAVERERQALLDDLRSKFAGNPAS